MPLVIFLWHRVLIASIHVDSIHYVKTKTTRAAVTPGIAFKRRRLKTS